LDATVWSVKWPET